MKAATNLRRLTVRFALAAVFIVVAARAYAADQPAVQLSGPHATPRDLEDTTEKAIVRDYAKAWASLNDAMSQNDASGLNEMWVGFAREEFSNTITQQQAAGMTTRYLDHGHRLEPVFYSIEGSSMQLRDTAQIETQVLDGSKIVASHTDSMHYLVVMTPAADHWQVRILQAVPGF